MRLLRKTKDGGPSSPVDAFFLVEIKGLFSVALLKFNKGGREQFHTHAFNAITWFLSGRLTEEDMDGSKYQYSNSLMPKYTPKLKNHRVIAGEDSWCLTIRGPWSRMWSEYDPSTKEITIFGHGRVVIQKIPHL